MWGLYLRQFSHLSHRCIWQEVLWKVSLDSFGNFLLNTVDEGWVSWKQFFTGFQNTLKAEFEYLNLNQILLFYKYSFYNPKQMYGFFKFIFELNHHTSLILPHSLSYSGWFLFSNWSETYSSLLPKHLLSCISRYQSMSENCWGICEFVK